MRHILLATSLAAAFVVPTLAEAQTRCQQQQAENRAAGTVIGAVGGALLGSAIAGRGDRTAGAVVGGVGGAFVGNSIASSNGRCPDGYVAVADPDYAPPPPPPPGAYPYVGAAPSIEAIHMQEDQLRRRIDTARDRGRLDRGQADGLSEDLRRIQDREQDLRDRHRGRLTEDDRFYLRSELDQLSLRIRDERVAGAPPPPPPPPPAETLWAGAPQGLMQRADWLQQRINDDANRRILTRAGVGEAQSALDGFRGEMSTLRSRDGGQLRDVDRQYLSDRLDYLARRIEYLEQIRR